MNHIGASNIAQRVTLLLFLFVPLAGQKSIPLQKVMAFYWRKKRTGFF